MTSPPTLSVVLPMFNEAAAIEGNLQTIVSTLGASGESFEVICVSDGSTDATAENARRVDDRRVVVLEYAENAGKGYALRYGSMRATGRYVGWLDADLDLHPDSLLVFLDLARDRDLDIVVGSKRHPRSIVDYPGRRRAYSWLYQQLVRVLFGLRVRDTQVGIKLFRHETLKDVLPSTLVKRYAFDLEVLALAHACGYRRIEEGPVTLQYRFSGTSVNWRAIYRALLDTAAIFYRLRIRRSYQLPTVNGASAATAGRGIPGHEAGG
jgi:glycosyltransferase involved in cell wall biosynthesis